MHIMLGPFKHLVYSLGPLYVGAAFEPKDWERRETHFEIKNFDLVSNQHRKGVQK